MIRNVLMFVGLSILALSVTGCCACRHGGCSTPSFNQGYAQPPIGEQYQQPGVSLPNLQQTQQGLGQFGRNLGSRFTNGILNRGVNSVINGAISQF